MAEAHIIDVHAHVRIDAESDHETQVQVEHTLRKMDLNGIDAVVLSPHPSYETPLGTQSTRHQNTSVRSILDRWPDRFPWGLGVAEPRHGDRAAAEATIAVQDLGLSGLIFDHDVAGLPIDGDAMRPILDALRAPHPRIVAVATYAYGVLRSPFRLVRMARAYPELSFINMGAFQDITHESASIDMAEQLPNVYFSLSLAKTQLFTVEKAVAAAGADRVLFGSGLHDVEVSHHLEMVKIANISPEERAAVLGGAAAQLFGGQSL